MTESIKEPFRLDFRSQGGEVMANLPGPFDSRIVVQEYDTWLRVRSDEKLAVLALTRHNGDLVDRAVGLFSLKLDEQQLDKLEAAVLSTPWTKLPTPTRGDVTANNLALDYRRGGKTIRRGFNARNREFIAAIDLLMDRLNRLMSAMLTRPLGAVSVAVEATPDPADKHRRLLEYVLHNPGTSPIVLTDPRALPPNGRDLRGQLLVATAPRETPGMMTVPPRWSPVPLPPLPEGEPTIRTLAAGDKLSIAVPWQPSGPGSYLVQALWSDYGGPITPASDPLPIMPLRGDDEEPPVGSEVVVRGATFSSYKPYVLAPEKPR
ncbi:MAG: hypothetical protein IAG13_20665 [Deltaproteobacteria bacterium]|nr:hypothetical protein [Nannocystaceae bacterium]